MKYYFITNPAAGKKNVTEELFSNITKVCEEKGVSYEIYRTKCAGDATDFVKGVCEANADGDELCFFACGGDGTLNEVASGTVDYPFASVGLIPRGTGNDFVRNFTDPSIFLDVSSQLDGSTHTVDILRCNEKYSVNMINIGFDCEVVKRMVRIKRSPLVPSKLAYIFALVITMIKKPGVKVKIKKADGNENDMSLLLTTFANGCFCGGGFRSNPYAELRDGKINALFVNNVSRLKFLMLVSSYKKGTHIVPKNEKILSSTTCESFELHFPASQSISIDGELHEVDKILKIDAIRGALRFRIPAGSGFVKEKDAGAIEKSAVGV